MNVQFYDIKKLDELDKKLSKNLMDADGHTWDKGHKPYWINYRNDIPNCLAVIREYKNLLEKMEEEKFSWPLEKKDEEKQQK